MSQLLEDVVKRLVTQDAGESSTSTRLFQFRANLNHRKESRVKVEAATQLRDNLDVFTNPPSYPVFLKRVMPIFINILNGPCIFQSNSNEQVLGIYSPRLHIGQKLTHKCHRNCEIPSLRSFIAFQPNHYPPNRSNHSHSKPSIS